MSIPTYNPENAGKADANRVFGLPEVVDNFMLQYQQTAIKVLGLELAMDTAEENIQDLRKDVFGDPSQTGDLAKSLRTLIAELQDRVTALENAQTGT